MPFPPPPPRDSASRRLIINSCHILKFQLVANKSGRGKTYLLPVPRRIAHSQHPVPNRTRAQVVQHDVRRDRQYGSVIRDARKV